MRTRFSRRLFSLVVTIGLAAACSRGASAAGLAEALVAENGEARLAIVVADTAGDATRRAAVELAAQLQRLTGAAFAITNGDGTSGLAVGTAADFPTLGYAAVFRPDDPDGREAYLLRSHTNGLHLVGAAELGVRHAVWDLLHRAGYRQFFPGTRWEVVPKTPTLRVAVDARERPAYRSRRIWYGFGTWPEFKDSLRDWVVRNRMDGAFALNTGHAYDQIRRAHAAVFEQHPEWLGLVKGQRTSTKFCISNPDLRRFIAARAAERAAADPSLECISMEPSDGGGWCECEACAKLGTISDRALLLANDVAAALEAVRPGLQVGLYAYNQHSPPPTNVRAHPAVIVSVATAFLQGGHTPDTLLAGWGAQGVTQFGIREYYSVNTWDRDLPGRAKGGKLAYLARTIPAFHERGARHLTAESSANWGPNGLGYYLAARMLWDPSEANRLQDLLDDFLSRAFGPAAEPMRAFYALLDGSRPQPVSTDLVGRMYRRLDEAFQAADDPAIRARLEDLLLYTRYVELFRGYGASQGRERQAAFETLIRFAYRMRGSQMVHSYALYRDLVNRDKSVTIPPEAAFNVPETPTKKDSRANPWKSSAPFTDAELETIRRNGIAANPVVDFEPVGYSQDLVPAAPLGLADPATGQMGHYTRGRNTFHTWVADPAQPLRLKVTGGLIAHYRNRGDVTLALIPAEEPEGRAVAEARVPPDGEERTVELATTYEGLHTLVKSDGNDATSLAWEDGTPMTVVATMESPFTFYHRSDAVFYVPRGTRVIGGFASGEGELTDPDGRTALRFDKKSDYFRVEVPEGRDGKLWRFTNTSGTRMLLTVPPCLARNGRELLLPREVVEQDRPR
jgi:hypothetical protein